ncbi:unnamed protein product [Clonostachys rosea]|uniref:Cytochrome P450 n=1 Tax=Bionectria ochroleuca TaxID=29856 RepID=A0ABY6TS56_BIOOC|nr:unnamed protein product [Clonostachys rosea]
MFNHLVLAALSLITTYLFIQLRYKRLQQFAHLPQLPPSLVWGHMIVYDEFSKRGKKDRHPDLVFDSINKALGSPPVMLVDMRPVSKPAAVITSHDLAEQVAKSSELFPRSLPKNPCIIDLVHLIGPNSIISAEGIDDYTPEFLSYTADQLRSFFPVGHDTTSILMGWILYELSRNPHALKAVRAELDEICGTDPDPAVVRAKLYEGGEDLIRRMTYISAVIKETIRLHPPASTARYSKPGTGFTVRTANGEEHCLDGCIIYNCHTIIHRGRSVYGDTADDFIPERWLGDTDTSDVGDSLEKRQSVNANRNFPAIAWRPFERGPRNCIGQELANLEARIRVAFIIRKHNFVKIGLGEIKRNDNAQPALGDNGSYRVKEEPYPVSIRRRFPRWIKLTTPEDVTSENTKPVHGMKMKVKVASAS